MTMANSQTTGVVRVLSRIYRFAFLPLTVLANVVCLCADYGPMKALSLLRTGKARFDSSGDIWVKKDNTCV